MKVNSIEPISGHRVSTDEKGWSEYTRYSANCWTVAMGESDESVYDCTKLEQAYQEYLKINNTKL